MDFRIVLLITILIRTPTFLSAENRNYEECGQLFQCGSMKNISYPFYGDSRPDYCGHPRFHLTNCQSNGAPTIEINSFIYRIKSIDSDAHIIKLVRDDFSNTVCPQFLRNATVESRPHFNYESGTSDLVLYYNCSRGAGMQQQPNQISCFANTSFIEAYYAMSGVGLSKGVTCETSVSVRVESDAIVNINTESFNVTKSILDGFGVTWDASNDECDECVRKGGRCGSDPGSGSFQCYGRNSMKPKFKVIFGVCVIGALLSLIGVWYLCKVVKQDINKREKEKFFKKNGGLLLQQQLLSGDGNVEKIKLFKSYELGKATNLYDVDLVLGQGGQGTVYKGIMSDGRLVAVKKSKIVHTTNIELFINEVVILSQINHRNIVKLLGCCLETEVPILVYEFISNGTLFQHIHNPIEEFPLTWEVRLRISVEIAGSLSYLHNAASMPIFHRDIKSTNILLDDKYRAKISDFGISRSVDVEKTHLTTQVKGTFGYLDPEYFQSSQFNEKSDVYSFGVVLVELLTGQKPIFSNIYKEFKGLASHFLELMENNHLLEMIDPKLLTENKMEEMVDVVLPSFCNNSGT